MQLNSMIDLALIIQRKIYKYNICKKTREKKKKN